MNVDSISLTLQKLHRQKLTGEWNYCNSLNNGQVVWNNSLDYEFLLNCLRHSSAKIKILALTLIADSQKSTLSFSQEELNLIYIFIKFNLGKKFEFIPLMKKVLLRLNNSTALLQRNIVQANKFEMINQCTETHEQLHSIDKTECEELVRASMQSLEIYRKFFIDLREICLNSLFFGATHIRTENSLLLLKLQQQFWDFRNGDEVFEWTTDHVNKLFRCLALSTYESSKIIAYDIISNIKPSILQLDVKEKVQEIFDVAIKLANSMRPIDTITAAYMLKVCIMSPIIGEIIESQWCIESRDDVALQLVIVLLECLEKPAKLAHEDLIQAISKHSFYGYIFCIRIVMSYCDLRHACHEHWQDVITKVINTCLSLNTAVSIIVNSSSPEGHFPMDSNEKSSCITKKDSDLITVTPQMVLLCSWRTVKETSLLFGYMMEKLPINDNELTSGILSSHHIMKIGNHLVTLLCEIKHRGAFEQAYVGFDQFCSKLWGLTNKQYNGIPKTLLYQLLLAITGLATRNSKFCATRRSAGVPFMLQALVTSNMFLKNNEAMAFHPIMRILLGLMEIKNENQLSVTARKLIDSETFFSNSKDCQIIDTRQCFSIINPENGHKLVTIIDLKIHILNILRALFKNAWLGNSSLVYAADGIIIAVKNYDSEMWVVRNAATLLFSALMIKIFGVQRTKDYINLTACNKMTVRLFFEKYPRLESFMLTELKLFINGDQKLIKPSIQSIILILSRLYFSTNIDNTNTDWKIGEYVELISKVAKSMACTTRELAARAIVPLLTEKFVCSFVNQLFYNIEIESKTCHMHRWNSIHGYILQILQIVRSNFFISCNLREMNVEAFLQNSMWIIRDKCWTSRNSICYPVAAVFIDVVDDLFRINEHNSGYVSHTYFYQILKESITHFMSDEISHQIGKDLFEYSTVKFFINWEGFKQFNYSLDEWLKIWTKILTHSNSEIQILGWYNLKKLLCQDYNKSKHKVSLLNSDTQYLLLSVAFKQALDKMKQNVFNRDLLAAIQEFLYQIYVNDENEELFCTQIQFDFEICMILVSSIKNRRSGVANTFKLFGKIYGKILKKSYSTHYDNLLNMDYLSSLVHEAFFHYSWTSSSEVDCRLAIAHVMKDIYINTTINNRQHSTDWWTTLLHLIVDDCIEVRETVLLTLSKLKLLNNHVTDYEPLEIFFEIFSDKFFNENDTAFAAYFFWCTSLSDKNYPIDKSDVFNRCYNYDTYEPLQISEMCNRYLRKLTKNIAISQFDFSNEIQKWLSKRLNMPISNCTNAQRLISAYKCHIPILNDNLYDILDPEYNEKLLLCLSFKKIESFYYND